METVRQRSERVHQSSKQIFPAANQQKEKDHQGKPKGIKQANKAGKPSNSKPAPPAVFEPEVTAPDDGPGLPSVRKLLAQFEGGDAGPGKGRPTVGRLQTNLARQHVVAPVESEKPAIVKQTEPETVREEARVITRSKSSSRAMALSSHGDDEGKVVGQNWDPLACVRSLYTVESVAGQDDDVSLDSQASPSIEGYMERLPAGRKKSTLWNSWKKQYFVARAGIVSVFSSRAQEEQTDRLEMFGGQVDFMDSNMLGLQDRRGQYIVVRCASHKAAREWEAALAFHTREEFCSTFLKPSPTIPKAGSIIVVDLGGASIRAGIVGPQPALPRLYFPSLMAASPSTPTEKYFGFDALKPDVRANCILSNPLLPSSKVDKYSVDLVALCGLLLRVFKDLQVDPKKHELQLSVPRCFNDKTKAAIASLLFDEFEVAAVNMGHQTTFALQSYGTDTGIVVDLGERLEVVPIVGGYKLAAGISRTATGGGDMGGHLRQALLGRNYSLTSQLEGYVVRQVTIYYHSQQSRIKQTLMLNRCWRIFAMWRKVTTGRWIDVKPIRRLSSAVCLCLEVRFD